ncbi:hypothetical protein ACL02U_17520 [Streptomyces sp. MS06]|uniref:hypothetical protein n=1 Tax=Streptomyces sp. MS06 TaxID=3385974 RepID=UPI0039A2A96A
MTHRAGRIRADHAGIKVAFTDALTRILSGSGGGGGRFCSWPFRVGRVAERVARP